MFERELNFFIENQADLVARYNGKVLVLHEGAVVDAYSTPLEAYLEAKKRFELGTFMIQRCVPGPEAYTVTIARSAMVRVLEA
jgi:hypothetical protein